MQLDLQRLNNWIEQEGLPLGAITGYRQFTGGYSNLTYLLSDAGGQQYVLRRPPLGAEDVQRGHDVAREFRILESLLRSGFDKVPIPVACCTERAVLGAPFYLMQKVEGEILRAADTAHLQASIRPAGWQQRSSALCKQLVALHSIDIEASGLIQLGKPEGYIKRQVLGWSQRYTAAQTDEIPLMPALSEWLTEHLPEEMVPTLLHNDFKYDNLIFAPEQDSHIRAILDWEMATVGDPRMDLGTAMSYWSEAGDSPFEHSFNLSWLPGNLSRRDFVAQYEALSGRDCSNILYFYVFGLFKNAVVMQQIYRRYKLGQSSDARFAALLKGVFVLSQKAQKSIEKDHI